MERRSFLTDVLGAGAAAAAPSTLHQVLRDKMGLSEDDIRDLLPAINNSKELKTNLATEIDKFETEQVKNTCQANLLPFMKHMWPTFIEGEHHAIMAEAFEDIAHGRIKRLAISVPPRHTKSEMFSVFGPSWFLGKWPGKKVIQCSNTADLATDFGRKVRNNVDDDKYKTIFSGVSLAQDRKAAGAWRTNRGGEYNAIGVEGKLAGKGADLLIIDDPHSEQDTKLASPALAFDKVYNWYLGGPRQRLQPGAGIVIVQTRWGKADLIGRVLRDVIEKPGSDEWTVISLPAILPPDKDQPYERSLWPGFWPLEELQLTKATLTREKWNAQYMQNPTSDENAIVKRTQWHLWESRRNTLSGRREMVFPKCDTIIQAWDTSEGRTDKSDFSACTTWGVFYTETEVPTLNSDPKKLDEEGRTAYESRSISNIILLDARQDRLAFGELRANVYALYNQWKPDYLLIETKNTGQALLTEIRLMGIPAIGFTPTRASGTKMDRLKAVTPVFENGRVWVPEDPKNPGNPEKWAEEVIEQFASGDKGDYDDLMDSGVLALTRFRQAGLLRLNTDAEEEKYEPRVFAAY